MTDDEPYELVYEKVSPKDSILDSKILHKILGTDSDFIGWNEDGNILIIDSEWIDVFTPAEMERIKYLRK